MKCVINLATGHYLKGQKRLSDSINEVEFFGFSKELQLDAPSHVSNPYAFKPYAFQWAKDRGYTQVLWVDASVWAIKSILPIFDVIEKEGYIMQEAGHMCDRWCNDNALKYFNITREKASKMPMYGNAGFLGLNFEDELANEFFDLWMKAANEGAFIGDWETHRHDMVCGSIIANKLKMKYKKGDEYLAYAGPSDLVNDNIYLKAKGL